MPDHFAPAYRAGIVLRHSFGFCNNLFNGFGAVQQFFACCQILLPTPAPQNTVAAYPAELLGQHLLGHKNVETTMIYTHVMRTMTNAPKSPLDLLAASAAAT